MLFFKIFLCISLVVIVYLSIRTIKYFAELKAKLETSYEKSSLA